MIGKVKREIDGDEYNFFFGPLTKYLYEKKTGKRWDEAVANIAGLPYFHLVEIIAASMNAHNQLNKVKSVVDEYQVISIIDRLGEQDASTEFVEVIKEGMITPTEGKQKATE